MAGRIRFYDFSARQALLFPADDSDANRRYGVCADNPALDFGTNDFAIEFAASWDSDIDATTGQYKVIAQKCPDHAALDNENGWCIRLNTENKRLRVDFNDGNANLIYFYWDDVWLAGTTNFFRLEFDRNVGCSLYKNGILQSIKTDIVNRQGSVSNAYNLIIGGQSGSTLSYLKGSIDLLRLDGGYLDFMDDTGTEYNVSSSISYGDQWNLEAYYKWRLVWLEELQHYRAAWYFNNSLTDESSNALEFVFKDGTDTGATATYANPFTAGVSYAFEFDPVANSYGPVDLHSRMRSLDGTIRVYRGANKQTKSLKFKITDIEQVYVILGAWYSNGPIHIHDYSTKPFEFRGYMVSSPVIDEVLRIGQPDDTNFRRMWEVVIELEEM